MDKALEEKIRRLLKTARAHKSINDVSDEIYFFWKLVTTAGYTLKDFGTSREEITSLVTKGNKSKARLWLDLYRQNKKSARSLSLDMPFIIDQLLYSLKTARCTLKDIGANKKEIRELSL